MHEGIADMKLVLGLLLATMVGTGYAACTYRTYCNDRHCAHCSLCCYDGKCSVICVS